MSTLDTLKHFGDTVKLQQEIEQSTKNVTIMFADLAGSTEFQVKSGYLFGLMKTYLHNSIVTEIIMKKMGS